MAPVNGLPRASAGPLLDAYSAFLLDLDGTLHRGAEAVPGAAQALESARAADRRLAFVTNNASRTPAQVVAHLVGLGFEASESEVLTSAQAGARATAILVPTGSAVLVVGGDGLTEAVLAEGLVPVQTAKEAPRAVLQGWFPGLDWPLLAEGAYALARGVPWVATNADLTLPTPAGVAPGNGSFVHMLASVSGREPDVIAGKPGPLMLLDAAGGDRQRALVVGDRLDTDIAGAVAAGLDSLLVLTGVTGVDELLDATVHERPTYVSWDLDGLGETHPAALADGEDAWVCRGARVSLVNDHLVVDVAGTSGDLIRAVSLASWTCADEGRSLVVDRATRLALHRRD